MSQHDMVIDNGNGLTVRSDINAAIAALVSTSAGPTEPTTTFAGQMWFDTADPNNARLWQRNASNSAWVRVYDISNADIGFGRRVSPDRFVWNDKADMSGTDVMTLSDTGILTLLGNLIAPTFNGFKPVQQGTGYQQLPANDVKLGFDGVGLKAQVDQLDMGRLFTQNNCVLGGSGSAFYARFPNSLMLQYGFFPNGQTADFYVNFATAFTNIISVVAVLRATVGIGNTLATIYVDEPTTTRFAARPRWATAWPATFCNLPGHYIAIGTG